MSDATEHFWNLAEPYLGRPGVTRGTMMGFGCLRYEGAFFATVHRASGDLIVKLDAPRVEELIAAGIGEPFAPAGKRFRAWVAIPERDDARWHLLIEEALQLAGAA